jgi:hypothetical protein
MYWYRSKLGVIVALTGCITLAASWSACKQDTEESRGPLKYFDIKGYFTGEAARLKKLNKQVLKTVTHNGISETKKVSIDNWDQELNLFTGSDINRPAWKNSYKIIADDSLLVYRAKYPELKMTEMIIKRDKGKVKWILIFNRIKNTLSQTKIVLYQTNEKLSYFPDSLYLIEKTQRVRLMGVNSYRVQGLISH